LKPDSGAPQPDADVAPDDAGADEGMLTVLNYNVHGLPPLITGDDTPGRMRLIGPLLNPFDVVGLQEDFEPMNHDLLTADSEHAYLEHFDAPLPNRLYGAGLTVLSAYEIAEYEQTHYVACFGELLGPGLTDCVASKGFQRARLRLAEGVEVDFYNTHMDAGGGAEDEQAREAQIDALLESFAQASAGRAVIYVGDTNASPSQLERLIEGADLRDACDEVGCPEPGRIERTFVRSGDGVHLTVQAWRTEPAFVQADGWPLSDHPAVSADIAWQRASP
jgi:endonuclease/exonuclease/phosphatase family metal-dependent hydrolase